jgi:hypothetical protein
MAWLATSAGISGEMVRDLMVACVERRFGISKAAHLPMQSFCLGRVFPSNNSVFTYDFIVAGERGFIPQSLSPAKVI